MGRMGVRRVVALSIFGMLFILLQYSLWGGKRNAFDLRLLNQQVDTIEGENMEFRRRNDLLHEDVIDIKNRTGAIESQARYDLGLIKRGETFYQIVRLPSD